VASIQTAADPADHTLGHIRYTHAGGLRAGNAGLKAVIGLAYRVQDSETAIQEQPGREWIPCSARG